MIRKRSRRDKRLFCSADLRNFASGITLPALSMSRSSALAPVFWSSTICEIWVCEFEEHAAGAVHLCVRNAQRHRLLVNCAAAYFFAAGFFLVGFLVGRLRPPPPPPGSPGPAPNSIVEGNVMVDSPFLEL